MTVTSWIVFAFGMWAIGMGTLYVCAAMVKDVDEAQTDMLARARRARFAAPRTRRTRAG